MPTDHFLPSRYSAQDIAMFESVGHKACFGDLPDGTEARVYALPDVTKRGYPNGLVNLYAVRMSDLAALDHDLGVYAGNEESAAHELLLPFLA